MNARLMAIIAASRPAVAGAVAIVAVATWPAVTSAGSAIDPPHRVGDVLIVEPYDQTRTVTHGDASTVFSLKLPAGSTCPGDSANDQWRIQTFLVPSTEDPTKIRYANIGPDPAGNGRYAMFGIDTVPFVHGYTQRNTAMGQPGIIPAFPPFDLQVAAGEKIPSGTYLIGVACTYFGKTSPYWTNEVIITESPDAKPGKLVWRLASEPASVNDPVRSSGVPTAIVFGGGTAALVLGWVFWRRRRTSLSLTLSKEPQ